eukprot:m.34370 g.34370  ORF g.34370 m.34370 type:complete len:990 (-) comp16967_c1_seq1:270-3239(-)
MAGSSMVYSFGKFLFRLGWLACFCVAGWHARDIRLKAIREYGPVIHEFDPWFNYRATEHLGAKVMEHGWYTGLGEFFTWYDYKVWYPLGRPVGTTIYPGIQMTSVAIWRTLNEIIGYEMSLNDVCCYVPAWFGVIATCLLGFITSECSGSWSAGAAAAGIMSIIPAHISRSVGGGYDNESIAMTAMCLTYYMWVRALRHDPTAKNGEHTRDSVIFGVLAGLAYINMVAAWGGFIFVLNIISLHTAVVCTYSILLNSYSSKLHRAFSLFFIVGTIGAIQIPVVGWNPLRNLDQLSGFVVFFYLQAIELCEIYRRKCNLSNWKLFKLRLSMFIVFTTVLVGTVMVLYPTGYFGPLGARIRGLFVKHTRTGNPLVDSVAEHQPASEQAYQQYLLNIYDIAPYGVLLSLLRWTDSNSFMVVYAVTGYYLCTKMARLIILLGPVASSLGGLVIGLAFDQLVLFPVWHFFAPFFAETKTKAEDEDKPKAVDNDAKKTQTDEKKDQKGKGKKSKAAATPKADAKAEKSAPEQATSQMVEIANKLVERVLAVYNHRVLCVARIAVAAYLIQQAIPKGKEFFEKSHELAKGMSNPQLMYKARLQSGEEIILDDYREGYWYLRDKTPEDSRIMAWWDYGYQITGIGNRTTIADGNTWNHEHIATLGRIMSAPEKRAHRIARHLADYVLVWAGGGGDDLAKSPHMARIGNSVFHDICSEPTCSEFGFYQGGIPTPMMKESLLYKLTQYGYKPEVKIDPNRFQHVFTSKYGKLRIFKIQKVSQESKEWVANPENRVCNPPGSWLCAGQYPPALDKLIAKRKNFAQLEDFNTKRDEQDDEYQKAYLSRMAGKAAPASKDDKGQETALKVVGCVSAEDDLGDKKVYGGGAAGGSIGLATSQAQQQKKKFMAIARVATDGHSFYFDNVKAAMKSKSFQAASAMDDGCKKACNDAADLFCGCADDNCDDLAPVDGETMVRRWVIYEVPKVQKKTTKKKKPTSDEL